MFTDFSSIQQSLASSGPQRIAVVSAQEEETLLALQKAAEQGIVYPVLIGDLNEITRIMKARRLVFPCDKVQAEDHARAAEIAVGMVARGEAGSLMKGLIPSADFLKAILAKDGGLRTGQPLSHITVVEAKNLNRLLFITDAAVNIAPDLERKRRILENAVHAAHILGNPEPVAAVLCAVEKVNPAMPATVDAEKLREMGLAGQLGCVKVAGPVSLDIAISREAALTKGIKDEMAGQADILLVPEIETGNVLVKALHYFAGLAHGGVILGASAPAVLVSRADDAEGKFNSLLLAACLAERTRHG